MITHVLLPLCKTFDWNEKDTETTEIQKTSFAKEIADINPY